MISFYIPLVCTLDRYSVYCYFLSSIGNEKGGVSWIHGDGVQTATLLVLGIRRRRLLQHSCLMHMGNLEVRRTSLNSALGLCFLAGWSVGWPSDDLTVEEEEAVNEKESRSSLFFGAF